ncbi:nuclease [Rhizobium sp. S-51]|uniref:Nuclease n=1 Tax=Rhizobium terricola TaxID=2728849 RepID=A0A7Y0AUP5_9HYPH|nr:nuclease [Rhizobium terricola]NML73794.1 nuclease [Rhizobium terricola]
MARTATSKGKPRKRASSRRKGSAGGGFGFWLLALVAVAVAIAIYDNRADLPRLIATYLPGPARHSAAEKPPTSASRAKTEAASNTATKPAAKPASKPAEGPTPPAEIGAEAVKAPATVPVPSGRPGDPSADGKGFSATFYFCGTSGLDNCVVDGDSFWFRKGRIALADVVAPATEGAKCQQERDRGFAAKVRLRQLLNAGRFEFSELKGQNVPESGPPMRVVTRDGRSLGAMLVSEGLAQPRFGQQKSWCP